MAVPRPRNAGWPVYISHKKTNNSMNADTRSAHAKHNIEREDKRKLTSPLWLRRPVIARYFVTVPFARLALLGPR